MKTHNRKSTLLLHNIIYWLYIIAFLFSGCSDGVDSQKGDQNQLVPAVEAVQARYGALPLTERLTGIVQAKNQIEIYPEINAVITEVFVTNGYNVKNGQPLVKLRDKEFQEQLKQARASYQITVAQVKQAEALLKETQGELERTKALAQQGLVSASELEAMESQTVSAEASVELAKARLSQAEATVEEREEALSQTIIRAPISGTVGTRNAEVGMLVNSNARLFTLGQMDSVRVEVLLTDRMLNYIEKGHRTEIHLESRLSGPLNAKISRISPFLHPVTHSTEAEIDLANLDGLLKPGMFVAVDVYYGEREQATLVPLSSIYENPATGTTGVYVSQGALNQEPVGAVDSNNSTSLTNPVPFKFLPVEVIAKGRMQAAIVGVNPGNWIVTLGQDLLGGESSSARVRVVNWGWVEKLQNLQRQDLLREVMEGQQETRKDTNFSSPYSPSTN